MPAILPHSDAWRHAPRVARYVRSCVASSSRRSLYVRRVACGRRSTMTFLSDQSVRSAASASYVRRRSMFRADAFFAVFLLITTAHRGASDWLLMSVVLCDTRRTPCLKVRSKSARESRSRFLSTLYGEPLASLCSAATDDALAARGTHAHKKPMGCLALLFFRLVCSLRHTKSRVTITWVSEKENRHTLKCVAVPLMSA